MTDWYVKRDEKRDGPYTSAQMKEMAQKGHLLPIDWVTRGDSEKWMPASNVKGLFAAQGTPAVTPPPLPAGAVPPPMPQQAPAGTPPPLPPNGSSTSAAVVQPVINAGTAPALQNPLLIGCSLLACFPLGLVLLYLHPRVPKGVKWGVTGAFACLMCCGLIGAIVESVVTSRNLAEAERLWAGGQKAEAVAKYKTLIESNSVPKSQSPTIYQRVIDFEADQGNTSAAKALIEKAVESGITLSLTGGKAKELYAQAQAEREAKMKAEREAKATKTDEANQAKNNFIGNQAYYPYPEGKKRTFHHALYLPNGSTMVTQFLYQYPGKGEISRRSVRIGSLEGSDLATGKVAWLKKTDIASKYPEHYRVTEQFVEIGSHLSENDRITWEPVLKLQAKAGDRWEWKIPGVQAVEYELTKFETKNGKEICIVRSTTINEDLGGVVIKFSTYAKNKGLIEQSSALATKTSMKMLYETIEVLDY